MADDPAVSQAPLSPEEAQAKAAILAECENLAAAGVTFVAVHFDGYGDSGVTEEVQCFDSEYYAYEELKPVAHDAAYLQEHFETLVPFGYENECGGFGDVVPVLLRLRGAQRRRRNPLGRLLRRCAPRKKHPVMAGLHRLDPAIYSNRFQSIESAWHRATR